jgi:hypothetical protein
MLESGPWPRSMSIAGLVSAGAARLPLPHGQDQCRCEQQQAAQHREGIALTHDHRLFAEDLTECHERLLLRRSPIADPVARRTRPPRSRSGAIGRAPRGRLGCNRRANRSDLAGPPTAGTAAARATSLTCRADVCRRSLPPTCPVARQRAGPIKHDLHRDALDDLGEISGGIVGGAAT